MTRRETLLIGELADAAGVNLETVRYYERRGLLSRPPRTASGYRLFPLDAVKQVRFVRHAQALGFTLREIKELLGLRVTSDSTCADVRRRASAKILDIEHKTAALAAMKAALTDLLSSCAKRGPASKCTFLERLEAAD